MTHFFAVVDKDADSAWSVWFPDVKGCFSAADELDDVLPNAIEALSLHMEGLVIPEARDIIEIRQEVKDELAQGAFLWAIPFLSFAYSQVRVNISLDKGTLAAIDEAATMRKLTRSAFIAEAAKNEIEGRKPTSNKDSRRKAEAPKVRKPLSGEDTLGQITLPIRTIKPG